MLKLLHAIEGREGQSNLGMYKKDVSSQCFSPSDFEADPRAKPFLNFRYVAGSRMLAYAFPPFSAVDGNKQNNLISKVLHSIMENANIFSAAQAHSPGRDVRMYVHAMIAYTKTDNHQPAAAVGCQWEVRFLLI